MNVDDYTEDWAAYPRWVTLALAAQPGATEPPFHEVRVQEHGEQESPSRCDGSIEQRPRLDRELMGMRMYKHGVFLTSLLDEVTSIRRSCFFGAQAVLNSKDDRPPRTFTA